MEERFKKYNLDYKFGYILGEAEIVDCIKVNQEFSDKLKNIDHVIYGRSNHVEKYAWKLENIKKYDNPIPCKGKLGLWNYGDETMYQMKLQPEPFEKIKNGDKTIEIRLYDEKRRLIKKNDTIEFTNVSNGEKIYVEVLKLHKFKNFKELYEYFDKRMLGYSDNEIANADDMNKYYSYDEQEKYGVVGIEIKLK